MLVDADGTVIQAGIEDGLDPPEVVAVVQVGGTGVVVGRVGIGVHRIHQAHHRVRDVVGEPFRAVEIVRPAHARGEGLAAVDLPADGRGNVPAPAHSQAGYVDDLVGNGGRRRVGLEACVVTVGTGPGNAQAYAEPILEALVDIQPDIVGFGVRVALIDRRGALFRQVILPVVVAAVRLAAIVRQAEAAVEVDAAVAQILVAVEGEVVGLAGADRAGTLLFRTRIVFLAGEIDLLGKRLADVVCV